MTRKSLCAALLAATTIAGTAAAETELTFNIFFPPTHFAWPVFEAWAADISEATGGEVSIKFPPQSVAPPPGIVDAVRNGVADGGFIFNGFLAQNAPGTMLTQMPFIDLGNSEAMSVAFWETYRDTFVEVEDLRGVEVVSGFHLGPTYLCSTTDTPITTLDELQGRRVWALPGTIADTLAAMDLAITASPAVQLQELTSRNTVDAHLGVTMETIVAFGVAPSPSPASRWSQRFSRPASRSSLTNALGIVFRMRSGQPFPSCRVPRWRHDWVLQPTSPMMKRAPSWKRWV